MAAPKATAAELLENRFRDLLAVVDSVESVCLSIGDILEFRARKAANIPTGQGYGVRNMTTARIQHMNKRAATGTRQLAQLEKARTVAHGGWQGAMEGVMQLPGDTAEERAFNVTQIETLLDAWRAFCQVYGSEMDAARGTR